MSNRNDAVRQKLGQVHLSPTLATMAAIYKLPREGGPSSERFQRYVALAAHQPGIAAYNPMAGNAALETVEALLALDAETIVTDTARQVVALCNYPDDFTVCIAVRSAGMWTHRVATEVDERAGDKPRALGGGVVSVWTREPNSKSDIVREAAAESVRIMWTTMHGQAGSVRTLLAREGLAYAVAETVVAEIDRESTAEVTHPYFAPVTDEEALAVIAALEVLGESNAVADKAGVLFGDSACEALGWSPLAVPDMAGYRWATARAATQVATLGPAAALLTGVSP